MVLTSNLTTSKLTQLTLISAAAIAVAVADVLLKKATAHGNLEQAIRSPWLWGAVGLYLLQIGFFTYAFVLGWQLSHSGALQSALYALIVLASSIILYGETVTPTQVVGRFWRSAVWWSATGDDEEAGATGICCVSAAR